MPYRDIIANICYRRIWEHGFKVDMLKINIYSNLTINYSLQLAQNFIHNIALTLKLNQLSILKLTILVKSSGSKPSS